MNNNPAGWEANGNENPHYFTDEQLKKFFAAIELASNPRKRVRDRAMFQLMLDYGLRCAEVPLIKLEHVDLRDLPEVSRIMITRVKKKRDKKTGLPKPRDVRWYPLTERSRVALVVWLKARRKFKTATMSDHLFITAVSGEISIPHIYETTIIYAKLAGLTKIHPHMLRHTCAIRLARKGLSAYSVKERLGHVSILSSEIYVRLAGPERAAEDARANAALADED